jgi:hypothetical protein
MLALFGVTVVLTFLTCDLAASFSGVLPARLNPALRSSGSVNQVTTTPHG